jgi:hypothetical protein
MTKRKARKDQAAVTLGRRGGTRRWRNVPTSERSRIMSETVKARWAKREPR